MLNSFVPITLKIGVKQKPRKVDRLASLQDVIDIVEKSAKGIPKPWHLSFNNTPLRNWAEAVQFFDFSKTARLEITVRDGLLPQPAGFPDHPPGFSDQPPGFSGKRLRDEEAPEIEMRTMKRTRLADDAVLTRITLGQKTKPRRFPKELTTSELLALLVDIFPNIVGKKYHLEYLDGYWVNDGEDWAVMQEVVQPEDYVNGRINLTLAFDSVMPPVAQPPKAHQTKKSAPTNPRLAIQQRPSSVPLASSSNISPTSGNKSLPQAILQGNYRGGLSEYLMKDPSTRNHQLSFNTTTISGVKKSSFQTVCLLVLGGTTYQASATGQSKKTSVHNSAKQMLVQLGVIPANYIMGQNLSNQPIQPAGGNSFNSGSRFNQSGRFNQGRTGFNQGGRGFNQGSGGFNTSGGFNQGMGGGSPWTQFLAMQQNAGSGNWSKAQKNEYHNGRMNSIWEQVQSIMRRTRQPMNVLWIRKEFPGSKESRPRRKELNYLLYKKNEEGFLSRNETGDKPLWELLC